MSENRGSGRGTGERDGTYRYHLPVDPDQAEIAAAQLWAAGALGVLEHPDELVAWFVSAEAATPTGGVWAFEPDCDWQAAWKATLHPVRAGAFMVVPSWLADTHTAEPGDVTLVLDPGRAFGSGHHATTALCLEMLDAEHLDGRTVADIGSGSGILSIAAAMRGARVVAVDLDPEAIAVTRENAARNGITLDARLGSVEVLDAPVGIVVANLVTDVILPLLPRLVAACRSCLILSGIGVGRADEVAAVLEANGATVTDRRERDGWTALRAIRPEISDRGTSGPWS